MLLLQLPLVPELPISFFRKADSFSPFSLVDEVLFFLFIVFFTNKKQTFSPDDTCRTIVQ